MTRTQPRQRQRFRRLRSLGVDDLRERPERAGRSALGLSPQYLVVPVPEPKTVKNQVHLDLCGEDAAAEVRSSRSVLSESPGWTTMADSDRNELCAPRGRARG
ncbi:VOC family protein [Curtobacterium sp. MCBD17_030]|uniref:VOC family protein n=1 Tax=Curtobacterium sp. MCBD17_030 TaxID=2175649 RepID=UPI0035CD32A5